MLMVRPDQDDPNCKHIRMTCSACVQLPSDVDGVDSSNDTQMLKPPHIIIFHLAALENGINPDIFTLKKEKGDIFSEWCTEIFK